MSEPNPQVLVVAPTKKSKTILVVALVAVLCGATAGALFMMNRHKGAVAKPAEPEVKSVLHLDTFVVNVGAPDESGYLRVGIDLGLTAEAKGEGKESAAPTSLLRDTILAVLTAAKPDELMTAEGKAKLKESVLQALRTRAPELNIHEVYFTEFLVQR